MRLVRPDSVDDRLDTTRLTVPNDIDTKVSMSTRFDYAFIRLSSIRRDACRIRRIAEKRSIKILRNTSYDFD